MLIAVTNRHLCQGNFLKHIHKIIRSRPDALILREKDLTEDTYQRLAGTCLTMCKKYGVQFIAHNFINAALNIGLTPLHLPMNTFITFHCSHVPRPAPSMRIGVSVHSTEDAVTAQRYGASYVVAGHIFATDSKKDTSPRGLAFLESVCKSVTIPVYAIGGITPDNIHDVMDQGAQGVCVMSPLMMTPQPEKSIAIYRKSINSRKPQSP